MCESPQPREVLEHTVINEYKEYLIDGSRSKISRGRTGRYTLMPGGDNER